MSIDARACRRQHCRRTERHAVSANAAIRVAGLRDRYVERGGFEISFNKPVTLKELVATKKFPAIRMASRDCRIRLLASCRRAAASPRYDAANAADDEYETDSRHAARRDQRPRGRADRCADRARAEISHR